MELTVDTIELELVAEVVPIDVGNDVVKYEKGSGVADDDDDDDDEPADEEVESR